MAAVQLAPGVWRIPPAPLDLLDAFLLEGDDGTLTLIDAGTERAPRAVLADIALSRTSATRLAELDFEVAGFAHGGHVSTGAPAAVRAFLAGRPS